MTKKQSYKFGIFAEKIVIFFLRLKGYKILHWRFKTYVGEIDIIAKKAKTVVFIEVKARNSQYLLEEIFRPNQVKRIKKAAELFILKNPQFKVFRFDFIEVGGIFSIKHHKNYFE